VAYQVRQQIESCFVEPDRLIHSCWPSFVSPQGVIDTSLHGPCSLPSPPALPPAPSSAHLPRTLDDDNALSRPPVHNARWLARGIVSRSVSSITRATSIKHEGSFVAWQSAKKHTDVTHARTYRPRWMWLTAAAETINQEQNKHATKPLQLLRIDGLKCDQQKQHSSCVS